MLTWTAFDIEVNGESRGTFGVTRNAFIAAIILRCHVVNEKLSLPGQEVNHSRVHLIFRTLRQPLASDATPIESDVRNAFGLARQPRRFSGIGRAFVGQRGMFHVWFI